MSDPQALPWRPLAALPCAHGGAVASGVIRAEPEHFRVDEVLAHPPEGDGEHAFIRVRKRDANTLWIADRLARLAGIPAHEVGYAGLKDRRAVVSQWFSVRLAGRTEPDWHALEDEELRLLEVTRGRRKLRAGALACNRFELRVTALEGSPAGLEARLSRIAAAGVPNYFGEQRFGRDYQNLAQAQRLFERRIRASSKRRGLYLSAVRAQLFNEVLAARVAAGSWNRAIGGDLMIRDGRRGWFGADDDPASGARCAALEIHPSGPLWGRGRHAVAGEAPALEAAVLAPFAAWRDGLERAGLEHERRALRVVPQGFESEVQGGVLILRFALPRGSFATALLREVVATGPGDGLSAARDPRP